MFAKVVTLFLASLIFQQIFCFTRVEIRSVYQPTLQRLSNVASTKYSEAEREYNAVINQINNNVVKTRNVTQTRINNIRQVLAEAKKNANATSVALNCLKTQEGKANSLSTTSLNSCSSSANITALKEVRGRFSTLSYVAANTLNYCQSLNPLEQQLEGYEQCLVTKVPDLNKQITIVEMIHQELIDASLNFTVRCLADNGGSILGQISIISYQISVCFFAPL